ncbi:hypothetical protein BVG80_08310 [Sphingobacteriales bacterium TSM_CSM]|nr:hypothetical protein BVG80_08310 [Sphingobacteriales bacterium TSM_CSM]
MAETKVWVSIGYEMIYPNSIAYYGKMQAAKWLSKPWFHSDLAANNKAYVATRKMASPHKYLKHKINKLFFLFISAC